MKLYLAVWEVQDSGYEIKGAFWREEQAQERVDALNLEALEEAWSHDKDHPAYKVKPVREEYFKQHKELFSDHSVVEIDVPPLETA